MSRYRILFLDAYDSFTNNIVSLLATLLDADVKVLRIDEARFNPRLPSFKDDWHHELAHFDALVCGPGPGSPVNDKDVGLMRHVWDLGDEHILPVLGICLGFQSLLCTFGADIRQLRQGLHGMIRSIGYRPASESVQSDIFAEVSPFRATLYHSLCVNVGQDDIPSSEWATAMWQRFERCPDIVPLAWVEEPREEGIERIFMAAKHAEKPFWGLQYHPESVCTEAAGQKVIQNWFKEAVRWNERRGRRALTSSEPFARLCVTPSQLDMMASTRAQNTLSNTKEYMNGASALAGVGLDFDFASRTVKLPSHIKVPDLVEMLGGSEGDQVVLDSSNCDVKIPHGTADVRGRHSIIALDVSQSLQFRYRAGDDHLEAKVPGKDTFHKVHLDPSWGNLWQFVSDFLGQRRISAPEGSDSPFLGGFMGYVSYEMGLHDLGIALSSDRSPHRPDVHWVWVTRSLVVNHVTGTLHVQELRPKSPQGEDWITGVLDRLHGSARWKGTTKTHNRISPQEGKADNHGSRITFPSKAEYKAKVKECQDYIAKGESYELCLTDKVFVRRPRKLSNTDGHTPVAQGNGVDGIKIRGDIASQEVESPWSLYKRLRIRQPAPFGSFIRLGTATFVSSSPERFLSCSRDGTCAMHPMKGTAKKGDAVRTLADAEKLLRIPKEEAENLMIVDLVRHDLHGVCGPGRVTVPHLLKIEEYASVFQMITVVKGQLPAPQVEEARYTAIDVLSASLPPGSMTGAPKRRSCEILQRIERGRERGIYSGVVGYADVTGKSDWSVNIRCLFRYDDECACGQGACARRTDVCGEVWHVGAGGAVTTLSTAEGECDEMFTKLEGSMGLFGGFH
ncbi:hypothetical protein jhhlp_002433 [Lomentospora prolificans]|uniref:aminodeoxychorismate synthase n=1 Tax=Lomentospora prolificans TaxID=41688 RepID=A0A2N3NE51_9PEZI|nr:hypothetical protein jhhlp_002433 [Lomentospora prolificans]